MWACYRSQRTTQLLALLLVCESANAQWPVTNRLCKKTHDQSLIRTPISYWCSDLCSEELAVKFLLYATTHGDTLRWPRRKPYCHYLTKRWHIGTLQSEDCPYSNPSLNTPSRIKIELSVYEPSYITELGRFFSYSHSKCILYQVYFLSFSITFLFGNDIHSNTLVPTDNSEKMVKRIARTLSPSQTYSDFCLSPLQRCWAHPHADLLAEMRPWDFHSFPWSEGSAHEPSTTQM